MGYTHYFEIDRTLTAEEFEIVGADARAIVKTAGDLGIALCGDYPDEDYAGVDVEACGSLHIMREPQLGEGKEGFARRSEKGIIVETQPDPAVSGVFALRDTNRKRRYRMYAVNKRTGSRIRGTYERLHGVAEGAEDSFRRNSDGNIEFDYEGGTEVFWDDSTIVQRDGKIVYLDDQGTEVTQDDIVLVEQLPEDAGSNGLHPLLRDRPDSNR